MRSPLIRTNQNDPQLESHFFILQCQLKVARTTESNKSHDRDGSKSADESTDKLRDICL